MKKKWFFVVSIFIAQCNTSETVFNDNLCNILEAEVPKALFV